MKNLMLLLIILIASVSSFAQEFLVSTGYSNTRGIIGVEYTIPTPFDRHGKEAIGIHTGFIPGIPNLSKLPGITEYSKMVTGATLYLHGAHKSSVFLSAGFTYEQVPESMKLSALKDEMMFTKVMSLGYRFKVNDKLGLKWEVYSALQNKETEPFGTNITIDYNLNFKKNYILRLLTKKIQLNKELLVNK